MDAPPVTHALPAMPELIPIAVVEDNADLRGDLVDFLQHQGFAAMGFADAEVFFATWPRQDFTLFLLDIALPGASGLEIAQRVRAQDAQAGIVLLTALDSNQNHSLGLDSGADMFLSKRSSLEVIEAACCSLLRRLGGAHAEAAALGGAWWRLLARQWELETPNHARLTLTHAEVVLLQALFASPGQAVSRTALLAQLGKPESLSSLRNLDNTVSRLKRKVQTACALEIPIRPSYGKGYTFAGLSAVEA